MRTAIILSIILITLLALGFVAFVYGLFFSSADQIRQAAQPEPLPVTSKQVTEIAPEVPSDAGEMPQPEVQVSSQPAPQAAVAAPKQRTVADELAEVMATSRVSASDQSIATQLLLDGDNWKPAGSSRGVDDALQGSSTAERFMRARSYVQWVYQTWDRALAKSQASEGKW